MELKRLDRFMCVALQRIIAQRRQLITSVNIIINIAYNFVNIMNVLLPSNNLDKNVLR